MPCSRSGNRTRDQQHAKQTCKPLIYTTVVITGRLMPFHCQLFTAWSVQNNHVRVTTIEVDNSQFLYKALLITLAPARLRLEPTNSHLPPPPASPSGNHVPTLLYEPYANESSQICPFLAGRAQFDIDHHQNRRLSSHLYSHESVIFLYFLD